MPEKIDQTGKAVPLFGTWRNAYLAIVFIFVIEVAFFYFVSGYYS